MSEKIIDPIHGFIDVNIASVQAILKHPYVQRMRRITHLGLTDMVYPGATHTRFQHMLGTMHIMRRVLEKLKAQSVPISCEEYESACIAALLHDLGHAPLSHTLEYQLLSENHETLGAELRHIVSQETGICFMKAEAMLNGTYSRHFFTTLLNGILDVDRMDYLSRDSFFTGVTEGRINLERLLEVVFVAGEQSVCVLEKGQDTVYDFLHARNMMYRQVYNHQAVWTVSCMLRAAIQRAKNLYLEGRSIEISTLLAKVYHTDTSKEEAIRAFAQLEDADIWMHLHRWAKHADRPLSIMSKGLVERHLFISFRQNHSFSEKKIQEAHFKTEKLLNLPSSEASNCILLEEKVLEDTVELEKTPVMTEVGRAYSIHKALNLPKHTFHIICFPKE